MNIPNKLYQLIELGLTDLEKCERDPSYTIDMDAWYTIRLDNVCAVCLAGSVLAQEYPAEHIRENWCSGRGLHFAYVPDLVRRALHILEYARTGSWRLVLECYYGWHKGNALHIVLDELPEIPEYRDDPDEFKRALRTAITVLQKHDI